MALSKQERIYYGGGFIFGMVMAIVLGILAGTDEGNRAAYITGSVGAGIAGLVCGIIFLIKR
ncbi:MAG: hypothetical protein OEM00_04855 [Burkholderiaceae bacterium]|nr:hypothetical protein [Burkholderiaceae bacterium]